jgi:hypothetical protein
MKSEERKSVIDLKEWELPLLETLEDDLVKELAGKKLVVYLDEDALGEQLQKQLFDRVRELAAVAVNETITYWLQGLAAGADVPELCIEFPYLQGDENAPPLTAAYSVSGEDESRTELHRIDLGAALLLHWGDEPRSLTQQRRAKVMGAALRELAGRIEATSPDRGAGPSRSS